MPNSYIRPCLGWSTPVAEICSELTGRCSDKEIDQVAELIRCLKMNRSDNKDIQEAIIRILRNNT